MIRTLICVGLLCVTPALADEPFSKEAGEAMNSCISAYSDDDTELERYAFVEADEDDLSGWYRLTDAEDGWTSPHGEVLEQLELTFRNKALTGLLNITTTEHVYEQTEICFHKTGEPAVSLQTESYTFNWICDASGKQIASDDYVTVEKLTELSTGGLFTISTRLFTHGQEIAAERFCGPKAFLFQLHQPGIYLEPADQLLSGGLGTMRKHAQPLNP